MCTGNDLPYPPLHCLQSRGADPSIKTEDYDPYLNPGRKLPVEVRDALGLGVPARLPAAAPSCQRAGQCFAGCPLAALCGHGTEQNWRRPICPSILACRWLSMTTAAPSGASCWAWRRSMLGWPRRRSPTPTWAAGGPCMTMGWSRSRPGTGHTSIPTQVLTGCGVGRVGPGSGKMAPCSRGHKLLCYSS
jgi:hypothetical protein